MTDIKSIVSKLTLEEKCALCSGITNWRTTPILSQDIPSVFVADGPHGMRKEVQNVDVANIMQQSEPSTCFPPAVTLASTWDVNLVNKVGKELAEEAIDQNVDVVLGPGINIKRNPLCGRNFEYFSEDPYLAGQLSAAYVDGVQKQNVGTSLKHFAVNNQEYRRLSLSSEVDERALREIYLSAFETTVKKSQPYTLMCCYNPVNGVHGSDNKKLLNDILRDEWGFDGIVISDWGAVNDRVKGIVAGLDLEMPNSNGINDLEIKKAVEEGRLNIEDLDKVVARLLKFVYKCYENRSKHQGFKADYEKHFETACEVAAKGAVLLKNNENVLPLTKGKKITVIGALAKEMRYQGSGSSRINPYKLTSFTDYLDEIKEDYFYAEGYDFKEDKPNKALIKEAVELAKNSEQVLLFVGLTDEYESEGFDREHLDLPISHNALIEAIKEVNTNIIIVLSGGSPMSMPWLDDVKAVLNMYLCGCAGGKACYKLLFGEANPSGKLAETFPISLRDNPAYLYYQMGPQTVEYRESIFIGYRYFDTAKKDVMFPFGFGLSYTNFEYSDIKLDNKEIADTDTLKVSFKITNTGKMAGEEIAQVYIADNESTIFREEKALKGFVKVKLEVGETKDVEIELDKRSFAFYNVLVNDWTVESGEFTVMVGASSRDIRLSETVTVKSKKVAIKDYRQTAPVYYKLEHSADYSQIEFEELLERKLPDNAPLKKGQIDYNSTVGDIGICFLGKILKWATGAFSAIVLPKGSPEYLKKMVRLSALSIPLRNMYMMTNGMVSKKVVDGLIKRCNGYPFQGLGMIISGLIKKSPRKDANPNYKVK
ncbi:MAG TPA: glycoside hydrolase family 3 C-terminal domain-containing protein [Clostridia bacterium]|nr:glycoside hydrolase family 3 C-terminal domain-containing protein [Clostridia bacterium]